MNFGLFLFAYFAMFILSNLLLRFRDARGLQFLLSTQMDELMKSQKTVQDAVKELEAPPSQEVIEEATACHLRPVRLPLNK